jgi:hypothetical protein
MPGRGSWLEGHDHDLWEGMAHGDVWADPEEPRGLGAELEHMTHSFTHPSIQPTNPALARHRSKRFTEN